MPLKCPICGKKYYYDSKICHECEDYSKYSGLTNIDDYYIQKWNSGVFLEFDSIVFGRQKADDAYIQIASEPKFTKFKHRKDYDWNCESNIRFRNYITQKDHFFQLNALKHLNIENSRITGKEINNSLIYE